MRIRPSWLVVAAAAVLPRLAVVLYERGDILADRAEKSDRFAQTLVDHGTFGFIPGQPSAYTQPLYGWFLAALYWPFGHSWEAVAAAQLVVATATAFLVRAVARRFLDDGWATAAAVVATLNPYAIWHDAHVNREILDQLLAAALVLVTLRAADRFTARRAVLLGLLGGLAMLGNTRLFAIPVVLVAYILWRRGLGRRALAGGAVALAVAGLTVLPWLVRNRVEVGCFALTTDGRALWKANNPNTHATLASGQWIDNVPKLPSPPAFARINPEDAYTLYWRDHRLVHVDECAQMSFYENLAFSYWVNEPGGKLRLLPQAARMLWSPHVTETTGTSTGGTLNRLGRRWAAPAYAILVDALALVGVWLVPRAFAALGLLLLAYNTFAALVFAGATRYRLAWDFLIAVAAVAAVAWAAERLRSRRLA